MSRPVEVVLGLGRETRAWLAGVADLSAVRVLDEVAGGTVDVGGRPVDVVRVDLDDAAAALAALTGDTVVRVVRSPGVSPYRAGTAALIAAATRTDAPSATPTGLWLEAHAPADLVLVTGTKGKSTVTAMTGHLLAAAGRRAVVAGNIGTALTTVDPTVTRDDLVVEVSSYQLADLRLNRPADAAAFTTLLVDHVPWHGSVARYHADKLRLLDLAAWRVVGPQVAAAAPVAGRFDAVAAAPTAAVRAALAAAGMHAEHEAEAAMLALALAARRLRRDPTEVAAELAGALGTFTPLPHRLRPVATTGAGGDGGVVWVDDSIATIPEAALAALATWRTRGPVTLLLGGEDRGQPLEGLVAALAEEDVRAALLGGMGARLGAALAAAGTPVDGTRVAAVEDLAAAVTWAARVTPPGGAVLLSPAAPSFGAFRDFVHRAETFAALVLALPAARPLPGGTR
jgi:UDP-N-acetylmuramoylalanine--D-glutamate ligase